MIIARPQHQVPPVLKLTFKFQIFPPNLPISLRVFFTQRPVSLARCSAEKLILIIAPIDIQISRIHEFLNPIAFKRNLAPY